MEEAIEILQKQSRERTEREIGVVADVLREIEFFRKVVKESGENTLRGCSRKMKLKKFASGKFVFNYRDEADSFCIVLSGSVSILIPLQPWGAARDETYTKMAEFGVGGFFGEYSLITGTFRTASARCNEDTLIGVIYKQDYDKLLKYHHQKELYEITSVIGKLHAFKKYGGMNLAKLSVFFKRATYKRKQKVYKQGELPDAIYVIVAGEFKFTIRYMIEINRESNINDYLKLQENSRVYKKLQESPLKKIRDLQIVVKGPNEIFGYEEILDGNEPRISDCECANFTGELLYISSHDFLKYVKHPDTLDYLNSRKLTSLKWMKNRISQLKIIEESNVRNQYSSPKRNLTPSTNRAPLVSAKPVRHIIKVKPNSDIKLTRLCAGTKTPEPGSRHRDDSFHILETGRAKSPSGQSELLLSREYTKRLVSQLRPVKIDNSRLFRSKLFS